MQEHPQYKITSEQGWAQMAPILDDAMPIVRRSRRYIMFWWTAAALISASLIAIFALFSDTTTPDQPLATTQKTEHNSVSESPALKTLQTEVITKESDPKSQINNEKFTTKSSAANDTRNSSSNDLVLANRNKTNSDRRSDSKLQSTSAQLLETQKNFIVAQVLLNPTQNQELSGSVSNNQINNIDPNQNTILNPESSTVIISRSEVAILDALPLISESERALPSFTVTGEVITHHDQKKGLLSPFVFAGVTQGIPQGFGINAGIGTDVKLTSRLSMTADLGYQIHNLETSLFGYSKRAELDLAAAIPTQEDVNNGIGVYIPAESLSAATGNQKSFLVESIRQWHSSLGLKFDLNKHFYAEAGVGIGFGASARSTYPIVSNDINGNPATGDLFKVSRSLDSYEVIKTKNTSIFGGIGYKAGKKLALYAQWTHGLDTYLFNDPTLENARTKRSDYIKGLDVGLKYTL